MNIILSALLLGAAFAATCVILMIAAVVVLKIVDHFGK